MKRHLDMLTGDPFYRDDEGREFRRIVGGLGWPWDSQTPGALVVLGEDRSPNMDMSERTHAVRVLAEFESPSMEELFARMGMIRTHLLCDLWMADCKHRGVNVLDDYNRDMSLLRRPPVRVYHNTFANEFRFLDAFVDKRTRGEKSLFFGTHEIVRREYAQRTPEDLGKDLAQWPVLDAFLAALAEIETNKPRPVTQGKAAGVADPIGGF